MKRFTGWASFFLLSVTIFAVSVAAETPVERHGQLAVDGNRLVNKDGKPVQLRGMSYFWNVAGEASGYYNANVVKWLADDWKITVIRSAMTVNVTWGSGYIKDPAKNKAQVENIVDAAIANGIYAIIDWHIEGANDYETEAKTFFTEMATKYKNYPNVIYEIYNEPTTQTWASLKSYMQNVTDAIRAVDTKNPIVIGTPSWSKDVHLATADPINGENLLYALHFYANAKDHQAPLRTKATTALNNGKALFVTEFGTCNSNGGASGGVNDNSHNAAETDIWLDFLYQNKISWVNWSISKKDEAASALKPSASTAGNWNPETDLTPSGKYIREKLIAAQKLEDDTWGTTATLSPDRVVPNAQQTTESVIAPVGAKSNKFSVGPIPTTNGVKFFWQGTAVKSGSLKIYDAIGNSIKNISINESATGSSKQIIGSWDLTDTKSRRVIAGSYLVKGKLVTQRGSVVRVSSLFVVGN